MRLLIYNAENLIAMRKPQAPVIIKDLLKGSSHENEFPIPAYFLVAARRSVNGAVD